MSQNKGQTAFEFTMMIAVALTIAVAFLAAATSLMFDTSEQERRAALNGIGYAIQDEIILATTVNDGYLRNFTIPQRAGRFQYTVQSTTKAVMLTSGKTTITYPTPEYSGTFSKGWNEIHKDGSVTIS